jgi:hypothetical protein
MLAAAGMQDEAEKREDWIDGALIQLNSFRHLVRAAHTARLQGTAHPIGDVTTEAYLLFLLEQSDTVEDAIDAAVESRTPGDAPRRRIEHGLFRLRALLGAILPTPSREVSP